VIDQSFGMVTGDHLEYEISITDNSEPLRISLVWSDFPGDPAAAKALVNDLDLTLTAPGGAEYKGNVLSGGDSIVGGTYDVLNNVECTYLNNPATGIYTIRIDATNIAIGPQNFALVATGNFDDGYGLIQMDRVVYDDSDTINFRVEDTNNPAITVDITLTGSVSGDSETITLNALDINSGVFTGSMITDIGITVPEDGQLQVSDGETITATYSDTSPLHDSEAIAFIDIHGAVITNVYASDISGTSTIINWDTNENTDSTVYFREFGSPTWDSVYELYLTMDHEIPLTSLSENTKYEFWVESTDLYGRTTFDDRAGDYYTFTTRGVATGGPLILLVDDDFGSVSDLDGSPFELDWINNLEYNGWTYMHWDLDELGSPTTADLNQAPMIIWFVAEGYPQLGAADRNALAGYLDQPVTSSGTVPMAYIVGQDIGWDMTVGTDQDAVWYADYLKAEYLGDDADGGGGDESAGLPTPGQDPMCVIDIGHPLNDIYNFNDIDLEEDVYGLGNNRFWPDDINAIAPGVAAWDYNFHEYGGNAAGVVQTDGGAAGTARISYNAFSHDMIDSTNAGGNWDPAGSPPTIDPERAGVLDETIQWLLGGDHPTMDLIDPIGGETIISTTTHTITWSVVGASSIDVYYSPNSGQEYIKINGAPLPGDQTSMVWDISSLEDADTYRIKVVALGSAVYATLSDYSESLDFTIEHDVDFTPPITVPGSVVTDINPITPGEPVNLSAMIDDSLTGGSYIIAAEWCRGTNPNWPGTPMGVSDGIWDEIIEDVTVFISGAETASWNGGQWHKLWVRGQDSAGNWAGSYDTDIYVAGPPSPPYEMSVDIGWQFISFPVDITNTADIIFDDSINGDGNLNWTMILWYDPLDDVNHWKSYNNNYLGTQDMPLMDNSMGIWILVT
ncbi:MAG: fibronectin type III domain-containing protein, partial [Thermoplasmata archaeon]|nr:fibronectin type III domain-containing protein [Thermoplasmata archaeon]